ncbi:MAG: DUF1904 family protein [Bdellovibrionota bacterium]
MPHIRIRAMSDSAVKSLSSTLPVELTKILQIPEDSFTVEKIATTFYYMGNVVEGDPMLEVLWFDRGAELQNICGQKITELAKAHTKSEFVAVVFTALPKSHYYENGKHF